MLTLASQGPIGPRLGGHALAFAYAGVLLFALTIRLINIDRAPLWTDELFTLTYPKLGLQTMWTEGMSIEPTSPLYYSLIWLIQHLGGRSAFWLRLPSIVGSVAAVALTWAIGRELSGRQTPALIASAIFAAAPESVFFAQEARSYALQTAALALALFGFAQFLRRPDKLRPLTLYVVGAMLAVYLHPTSTIAIMAFNAMALAAAMGTRRLLSRASFLRWCLANLVVAVVAAPLVSTLISPKAGAAVTWIPEISRWWLEKLAGLFLAGPEMSSQAMRIAEIGVPAIALLIIASGWRPNRRTLLVVVGVPCVFLAAMVAISIKRPVLLDRTIFWLWVPLAVVLGEALSGRLRAVSVVVLAALLSTMTMQQMHAGQLKEDWRFLGHLPPLPPSALVILGPRTPPAALKLYAPNLVRLEQGSDGTQPVAETIVSERAFKLPKISLVDARRAIASGEPVYLIYRQADHLWASAVTASLDRPRIALQDTPGATPSVRALVW